MRLVKPILRHTIFSLRASRIRPAMSNLLARQRLELFAGTYSGSPAYPANSLLKGGKVKSPDRNHYIETQKSAIAALISRGIL